MIILTTDFIPNYIYKNLYKKANGKETIVQHHYEIVIYIKLKKMINNSNIFIPDSTKYCSLEKDLKDKKDFKLNMHKSVITLILIF